VKATKQVLDKIEVENKTLAKITPKERDEKRLWNPVALREAVINAMVHNDYTSEVPPKFEFFDDRIEITSFGSLPQGMTEKEFFEGYSVPRNKELMRVFRDLELVEHLGSGVPRILRSYGKECFKFTENFLRMTFPASEQVTEQVTEQVKKLVQILEKEAKSTNDLMAGLGLKHRQTFLYDYLRPALEQGFVEMTIPDKPNSSLQKYRLTILGKQLKNKLL
jgi:predicted HTH transcriptional regulator